jgi:type IV pilus assembly protein PilC
MLNKVADFYEREVREAVDNMSKLIEPLLMVVLGGIVGTLVIGMYLPIFKMASVV